MGKLTAVVQAKLGNEKALDLFKQDWKPLILYWKQNESIRNGTLYNMILEF